MLPPRQRHPHLDTSISTDVLIIGAGFAGLSAARRLLQIDPSLDVTLIDAGRVAEGAAGRNSGFMIDLPHDLSSESYAGEDTAGDRLQTALNRRAIDFARQLAADFGLDREVFDPCGKINGAATDKGDAHNRLYAEHLKIMDEPFEMYDEHAMRELTGTGYYISGLFTPGTVMLQPAAYIRGLADGLTDGAAVQDYPFREHARRFRCSRPPAHGGFKHPQVRHSGQ